LQELKESGTELAVMEVLTQACTEEKERLALSQDEWAMLEQAGARR
jgi:hypothetical protein